VAAGQAGLRIERYLAGGKKPLEVIRPNKPATQQGNQAVGLFEREIVGLDVSQRMRKGEDLAAPSTTLTPPSACAPCLPCC